MSIKTNTDDTPIITIVEDYADNGAFCQLFLVDSEGGRITSDEDYDAFIATVPFANETSTYSYDEIDYLKVLFIEWYNQTNQQ